MKTTHVIETVFGSPGRIAVLRRLATAPRPLSGRQVAELTGLTHRGAIQAMNILVAAGVVKQRRVGRAYQYTLASENVIAKTIILPALSAEEGLLDLIKAEVAAQFSNDALSIVLFGSLARGEETWQSDIDILVVTNNAAGKEKIERLADSVAAQFREKFGSQLSVHSLTLSELKSKKRLAFLPQAKKEGILISGKSLDELSGKHA